MHKGCMPTVRFKSSLSHNQAFCCCWRGKSVTCGPASTVRDSVGYDQNFRWAKTTILTSAAVFWGLQLCSQQCEGMGWDWTCSVSAVPGSWCSLLLLCIRDLSKRGVSAVHLLRGLWGESHTGSHSEVLGTLDLTWNNQCACSRGCRHFELRSTEVWNR